MFFWKLKSTQTQILAEELAGLPLLPRLLQLNTRLRLHFSDLDQREPLLLRTAGKSSGSPRESSRKRSLQQVLDLLRASLEPAEARAYFHANQGLQTLLSATARTLQGPDSQLHSQLGALTLPYQPPGWTFPENRPLLHTLQVLP